jgi:hypothetical protein
MTKRAHWYNCKKTIDTLSFSHILMDDILCSDAVPEQGILDTNILSTVDTAEKI